MVDLKIANEFTYIYDENGKKTVVDPTRDLVIHHGTLQEATGVDEIAQRLRLRIAKQLGEWRYNQASGVPWADYQGTVGILGSRNSTQRARSMIEDVVLATDGVKSVKTLQVRFDTVTRHFALQLEVETTYGSATIVI